MCNCCVQTVPLSDTNTCLGIHRYMPFISVRVVYYKKESPTLPEHWLCRRCRAIHHYVTTIVLFLIYPMAFLFLHAYTLLTLEQDRSTLTPTFQICVD